MSLEDYGAATFHRLYAAQKGEQDQVLVLEDPWPPKIAVTTALLEDADPAWITHGDGMLRFSLTNGDALYGYVEDLGNGVSGWELIRGFRKHGSNV